MKQFRIWVLINKVSICISDWGVVAASIQLQLHRYRNITVGIYLQSLVPLREKMDDPFSFCFKSFTSMMPSSFYSERSFPRPNKVTLFTSLKSSSSSGKATIGSTEGHGWTNLPSLWRYGPYDCPWPWRCGKGRLVGSGITGLDHDTSAI